MREIKFRAWDEKSKTMMQSVSILGLHEDFAYKQTRSWLHNSTEWDGDRENFIDSPILMQFTGLTDKKGKEIYFDSDVFLFKFTRTVDIGEDYSYSTTDKNGNREFKKIELLPCVLKYDPFAPYLWNEKYHLTQPLWVCRNDMENVEIIGNIYENPDLTN